MPKGSPFSEMLTAAALKSHAYELGFNLCGIAPATALPELTHLREWLDRGYAGEMLYLHRSADARADIRHFLPSARSVVVTGTLYYTGDGTDAIARYAWGEDYHLVLADRLQQLVAWMREQHAKDFEASIFVDKHHVQERVFARHAGLGWVGKNSCIINPEIGSWVFLAGVATSLELPIDTPLADQCGTCTLCLDACPTGALVDEYQLDATRCISYLTIEHQGAIPEDKRAALGNHIFGCDICQDVCPWNLAPLASLDPAWQPRAGRAEATAADLWRQSDFELHNMMEGSAMLRTTMSRLRRNLAVVLGNDGGRAAADALDHPGGSVPRSAQAAETELVQEHVRWAKDRLKY